MSKFLPGTPVEVRYPATTEEARGDREVWPWMAGVIEEVCGPDEWQVVVDVPVLADESAIEFPIVFRDSSEIRKVPA
jgi:hypothetical protein